MNARPHITQRQKYNLMQTSIDSIAKEAQAFDYGLVNTNSGTSEERQKSASKGFPTKDATADSGAYSL